MDESLALDPDPGGRGTVTDGGEDPRSVAQVLPTVVAVVVTHNPGPWFEESLASLVDQEYPNLSILVFDTGSTLDPTPRIAAIAPRAYVRRLESGVGFGAAINTALTMVEGAPFFLVCHDDVALAPTAVRLLVEEAYRSNAGVVGPKLVRWDEPAAMLAVGMGADRFGAPFPLCERGELDQEQHDGVRDVFFVPDACFLIRADLLRALGGFDEAITLHGADTDLCWRAHLAGARVLVAPSARARHVEALGERRADDRRKLQQRHRLRMVLTNYGWFYLLGELVQQAVLSLVELIGALLTGRVAHARELAGAWVWNLRRLPSVISKRRRVRAVRQVTDLELRRLQVRGSARLTGFLRGQVGGQHETTASLGDSIRQWAARRGAGAQPHNLLAALLVALVLAFGTRHLLTRSVPAVGEFALFPDRARDLLQVGWSGWREAGLGAPGVAPTGLGLLGLGGLVLLGATGLLRAVLILGTIPLGLVGAWRLGTFSAHSRAKGGMLLAYAANPLPYNALAAGRWGALALYGVLPWTVRALAQASGTEPHRMAGRDPFLRAGAVVALATAAAVALDPVSAVVVLVASVAMAIGSLLAGELRCAGRQLAAGMVGVAVGVALHAPWLLSAWANDDPGVRSLGGIGGAAESRLWDLLRFHSGRFGGSWVTWGLVVAGFAGLAIGRSWRLAWVVRGWCLYAAPLAIVVAVQSGLVDLSLPAAEVLLAPAALGLAVAVGAGVAAFDVDLPGYHFGWRQLASVVAAAGLAVATLPLLMHSFDGRWKTPRGGYDRVLGFVESEQAERGPFRVLWLGSADVLPVAGWAVGDGVTSYATTIGYPSVSSLWAGPETPATRSIPDALEVARGGGNNRLGQRLGVMGIRYVVVVDRSAPTPFNGREHPAAPWLDATLSSQLDLAEVELNAAMRVYRNTSWLPLNALVPAGVDDPARLPQPDVGERPVPALELVDFQRFEGELDDGDVLHLAEAFDPGWRLDVDGGSAQAGEGFGFANRYDVDEGGSATLRYRSGLTGPLMWAAQVLGWLLVAAVALRGPGRKRVARPGPTTDEPATATATATPLARATATASMAAASSTSVAGPAMAAGVAPGELSGQDAVAGVDDDPFELDETQWALPDLDDEPATPAFGEFSATGVVDPPLDPSVPPLSVRGMVPPDPFVDDGDDGVIDGPIDGDGHGDGAQR